MISNDFPSEEYRLLDGLKDYLNYSPSKRYPIGIGDDAVIRNCDSGEQLIFTADTLVENVHFSFEYLSPAEVGYKAMVANLSDCAAMGAIPDSALVQIVFPDRGKNRMDIEDRLRELYIGLNKACKRWNFPIVGGNLSIGPCWMLAISLTGRKDTEARILRRTGAEIGDELWVTGVPGMSAAGLEALKKWGRDDIPEEYRKLAEFHIAPCARVETGLKLADDSHVHAVIDLSDGISKECYTLCYENRVGILLSPEKDIVSPVVENLSSVLDKSWIKWFLYGGEDYELLFTASEGFNPLLYKEVNIHKIGIITDKKNSVAIIDFNGHSPVVEKYAWDHVRGPL